MNIETLHTNQKLLIKELIKRGATWEMVDEFEELVVIHYKSKNEYLLDRFSSKVAFHMVKVTADKYLTKTMLSKAGISVPLGQVFTSETQNEALNFASDIYPIVLKPNWGSHGDHVQVDLRDETSLKLAIEKFKKKTSSANAFILEQFKPWNEHRVFLTTLGDFAIVKREPASVIGDGVKNISQLIEEENIKRIKLKKTMSTSLCPIVIDDEVVRYLAQNEHTLDSIPTKGLKFFLRQESNLAKGGIAINMTKLVHPSLIDIAKRALNTFPGLPCVGLDILCKDITIKVEADDYVIIEANSSPGLAMHKYPSVGESENVEKILADVMFPDFFEEKDKNEN